MQIRRSQPCRCHANYFILHGIISDVQIVPVFIGLLARPERFERPTPRFVVWSFAHQVRTSLSGFFRPVFVGCDRDEPSAAAIMTRACRCFASNRRGRSGLSYAAQRRMSYSGRQARTKLELVATILLPYSVALPGMDQNSGGHLSKILHQIQYLMGWNRT